MASTRRSCWSEHQSRPSCQRGPSGNRSPSTSTVAVRSPTARGTSSGTRADARDGAEAAGLEVVDGLAELGLGRHHERSVAGDRLAQRLTREQQHLAGLGLVRRSSTATMSPSCANSDELALTGAADPVDHRVLRLRHRRLEARARRQRDVQVRHRRARVSTAPLHPIRPRPRSRGRRPRRRSAPAGIWSALNSW